jgi:hypothetical protein
MGIQEIAELCVTLHQQTTMPMTILAIQKVTREQGFPLEDPEEVVDLKAGAAGQDRLDGAEEEAQDQRAAAVMDLQGLMEVTEVLIQVDPEAGEELDPVPQVDRETGEELGRATQVDPEGTYHHRRQLPQHQSLLA